MLVFEICERWNKRLQRQRPIVRLQQLQNIERLGQNRNQIETLDLLRQRFTSQWGA